MKKEGKYSSGEQSVMTAYRIMARIALRRAIRGREEKYSGPEMYSQIVAEGEVAFPIGRRGQGCMP